MLRGFCRGCLPLKKREASAARQNRSFRIRPIASFRGAAVFGPYRGTADMAELAAGATGRE
jgi:hypothetical protein